MSLNTGHCCMMLGRRLSVLLWVEEGRGTELATQMTPLRCGSCC